MPHRDPEGFKLRLHLRDADSQFPLGGFLAAADIGMNADAVAAVLKFLEHVIAPYDTAGGEFTAFQSQSGAVLFEQVGVLAHQRPRAFQTPPGYHRRPSPPDAP